MVATPPFCLMYVDGSQSRPRRSGGSCARNLRSCHRSSGKSPAGQQCEELANQLRRRRTAPKMIQLDVDQSIADIAVEPSKDPHTLYTGNVEREQVHEAIQRLPWSLVRSSCCASMRSCPTRRSPLFWGARQEQSCRASEGLDRDFECCFPTSRRLAIDERRNLANESLR